jgi:hypothetical protein
MLASGCLLPPGVNEREPEANRAPRIVLDLVDPRIDEEATVTCSGVRYEASIEDADEGDEIWFRVFYDYPSASDAFRLYFAPRKAVVNSVGGLFTASFLVRANEAPFKSPLVGTHSVELFVADRPFADEQEPELGLVGRQIDDPDGRTASFIWAAQINETCQ